MTINEIETIINTGIEKYFEAREAYEEKKRGELELEKEKQRKVEKEKEKRALIMKLVLFVIIGSMLSYISYLAYDTVYQMFSLL